VFITLLRLAVGWHVLYEGISKFLSPGWTAQGFLSNSTGFLAGFYQWLASPGVINVVDILNVAGLIAIGLALFIGVWIRVASVAGVLLLALYYFAYPPFGISLMIQAEKSLFIVNKVFIEAAVITLFIFIKDKGFGVDRLLALWKEKKHDQTKQNVSEEIKNTRREALKNLASVPLLGLLGWGALNNRNKYDLDTLSGATIKIGALDLSELKGELPTGKIQDKKISRLVMGGNLIGGWAHARDLIYVSSLFKAYNTERKIFETLILGEKCGINTISVAHSSVPLMMKYKKATGSNMQVISQVMFNTKKQNYFDELNEAIDYGVDIVQILGSHTDWLVRDHKEDVIEKMLDEIRRQGYIAGLAAHTVNSLERCEELGIIPDYYMKTMHHDQYWSAHPMENRVPYEVDGTNYLDHNKFHNNIFCEFPERTKAFVQRAKVPVMGYKVLAAGAIQPEDGFRWAFENGADFICVGMFDFQIVNDANTAIDTLNNLKNRTRKWYG
jgi:uncharacterized membrane protein YphA (DoxX/SURF4 family)